MQISKAYAQSIVDEMKSVIHQDVNIMDRNGMILASTDPVRIGTVHTGAVQLLASHMDSLVIRREDARNGVQPGINLPIKHGQQMVGVIGITGDPQEVGVFGDVIRRMTELLLESTAERESAELREQARSIFLESCLFAPQPDYQALCTKGNALDIRLCQPYVVAAAHVGAQEGQSEWQTGRILQFVQRQLRQTSGCHAAVIHSELVLFLRLPPNESPRNIVERLAEAIRGFFCVRLSVGAAVSQGDPHELRRCYQQALLTLDTVLRCGGNATRFYQQANLEFTLSAIPEALRRDLTATVFSRCTPDETDDFCELIRLYFQEDGNLKACAQKRFQHRNTVQYHIDLLTERTGLCLRVPKDSILLYIAAGL